MKIHQNMHLNKCTLFHHYFVAFIKSVQCNTPGGDTNRWRDFNLLRHWIEI